MTLTRSSDLGDLAKRAFTKLSSYIYFDKQNLLIREKLAEFIKKGKQDSLEDFASKVSSYDSSIKKLIDEQIRLSFLPKSIKENSNKIDSSFLSKSFYTNQMFKEASFSDRLGIFIEAPLEIHLISVMWLLKYGSIFDKDLNDHCIGNRLEDNSKHLKGRLLFKKYEQQYQKWWSKGIEKAKGLFDSGKDVTILSFDFKDYYHSIELDLNELTNTILQNDMFAEIDNLHRIFLDIHKQYYVRFQRTRHSSIRKKLAIDFVSLPIGLLSSSVLANWYLRFFDDKILKELSPIYYGRYVDDLMIVLNNTIIKEFNQEHVAELQSHITFPQSHHYIIYYYIDKYLSNIFTLSKDDPPNYSVKMDIYSNLTLQSEKFTIYQFSSDFSPQLLTKFIEEQAEKSSAFQFLSEDDDNIYKELDKITFESNLDSEENEDGSLKDVEDNKFKLSVYLSKLTRGSVISGSDYNSKEIEKVKRYFKGYHLLRNYFFWEKLLSLWVVRENYEYFFSTIKDINHQIDSLSFKLQMTFDHNEVQLNRIADQTKLDLRRYLNVAIRMAVGLNPDLITNQREEDVALLATIRHLNLFRTTWLLRKNLVYFPLIQFSNAGNYPLYNKQTIDKIINATDKELNLIAKFFPYRVKFNECCQFIFLKWLHKYAHDTATHNKVKKDFFCSKEFLGESFDIFCKTNDISGDDRDEVQREYFNFFEFSDVYGVDGAVRVNPIKIPNSGSASDHLRVCLVNKYVDFRESEKSLKGTPVSDGSRFEEFNRILDDVKKVKNSDIYIMPEICLPYHFIPHISLFSVYNDIGVITGIEHLKVGELIFNFVLTALPIKVHNDRDVIIIPRLKNHYAPEEEHEITEVNKLRVPKPKPYHYDLLLWRQVYFSTYYCFELADVRHRNIFLGLVDIIFAPVWNKDVHYYNSLVESTSRDMHCFIVLANTTQYGDSRITRPADHIHRDKLRIKGGTVSTHKAIVVVSDLEISKLREFQIQLAFDVSNEGKLTDNNQSKFKPLPPDFPIGLAESRKGLLLFERLQSGYWRQFDSDLDTPF